MKWRGAKGTDEEFAAIVEYLATNFLGEAQPKLNMNRATSIELESVLSLLRKEAAAVIAYRDKVGGFKSIDDLKKVPGRRLQEDRSGQGSHHLLGRLAVHTCTIRQPDLDHGLSTARPDGHARVRHQLWRVGHRRQLGAGGR